MMARMDLIEGQCDRTLAFLGFTSLDDFFASRPWEIIQHEKLAADSMCAHCGRRAHLVRITRYTIAALSGKRPQDLESICLRCVDLL
jgi:hypothetical protein